MTARTPLRTISYGGGVQSTALLVLAARGVIDFRTFLLANVGDDSEHPDTLAYVRLVAAPYAAEHDIDLQILDRVRRDGTIETLWGRLTREGSRSLPIPVRMSNGAPGNRSCTADFKIKVTGKWLKQQGATGGKPCRAHKLEQQQLAADPADADLFPVDGCAKCTPANIATIGIGISLDEIERANTRKHEPHERVVYPLLSIGEDTGLKMRRSDCQQLIRSEPLSADLAAHLRAVADQLPRGTRQQLETSGYTTLPVPPKSSCFFCPFHKETAWEDLARDHPDLFDKSVALEKMLNDRRDELGKDHVYLTRFARPLDEVVNDGQELLPLAAGDGACDSGWCFT